MKYPENIEELSRLPIDYMGLIFYDKSPRFAEGLKIDELNILPERIERVGVFVNADVGYIMDKTNKYNLDIIQLHGNESADFCKELNKTMPVIKAFNISGASDFEQAKSYEDLWGYFLFDTKTAQYGGSGLKFDWNVLNEYKGNTPFFLSGGISVEDAERIKEINHPSLYAIDINSKFEINPGLKDIKLLNQFIKALDNEQN